MKLLRQALKVIADKSSGKHFNRAPMYLLDVWGHKLPIPKWIEHEICDVFDEWVGAYADSDTPDDDYSEQDCSD
jgi:hypothetical protein